MRKAIALTIGVIAILAVVGPREYFIHQEISSRQESIINEIRNQISSATTSQRVFELSQSAYAFDAFVEPIVIAAGRLLFSFSREDEINEWSKKVHTTLDDATRVKLNTFKTEFEKSLADLRLNTDPSLNRIVEAVKVAERSSAQFQCSGIVEEEVRLLKEFRDLKDKEALALIRDHGLEKIKELRERINAVDPTKLTAFLSSKAFTSEFKKPVMQMVLNIQSPELREKVWLVFEYKISQIVGRRQQSLAKSNSEREKRIQNMVESLADDLMTQN